jgi:bis(5'-nucleosidyl)-tetraphosphatase
MKQQFSAGIVTYTRTNGELEYLLLHYIAGHWDLPKGKIEQGETKEEAAQRELKEETRLTAVIDEGFEEHQTYFFTAPDGTFIQKTVYFFVGHASSKHVALSSEHAGFRWLPFDQAIKHLTFKTTQEIVKKAHVFLKENCT